MLLLLFPDIGKSKQLPKKANKKKPDIHERMFQVDNGKKQIFVYIYTRLLRTFSQFLTAFPHCKMDLYIKLILCFALLSIYNVRSSEVSSSNYDSRPQRNDQSTTGWPLRTGTDRPVFPVCIYGPPGTRAKLERLASKFSRDEPTTTARYTWSG